MNSGVQLVFPLQQTNMWSPPTEYVDLSDCDEVAIDLETRDDGINNGLGAGWALGKGEIIGFAVTSKHGSFYYPFGHLGGGNLIKEQVLRYMKDICALPCRKIFHNASYDVGWLQSYGIKVEGEIVDTMIAGCLIDENRYSYSLNALAKEYLGEIKAEQGLRESAQLYGVDPKNEMWKLPSEHVGHYAEQDSKLTYNLWQRFKHEIVKQNLTTIWELERDLLPHLIEMRSRGIRVDTDGAEKLKIDFKQKEKTILQNIKKLVGKDVDIWAARSIATAYDTLGIEYPKTVKTKEPSFTQQWLNDDTNDISKLIVQARELNKFHNTFINSILKYTHKGRIHAEINQLRGNNGGTVSGRLSMSNPNLQQLPARNKDFGNLIRGLFLPEEGEKWVALDYSQQEPRVAVHYSLALDFDGAKEIAKAYESGDGDFHQSVADLCGIDRKSAKSISLGLMYGMGKSKLANMLGLTFDEASSLIDKYNRKAPFLKMLSDKCMDKAQNEGVIRTKLGRKCRFDLFEPKDFGVHQAEKFENASAKYGAKNIKRAYTYKSLNRLIQGTSADSTKKAMLDCATLGHLPLLQVHDELCFSIKDKKDIEIIKKTMENCVEFLIPMKVDVAIGDNFGETI
tara:strand:- start:2215 stop:4086 length:1872 start_codon:yes stop_codon:yes gene_type:complete